MVVLLVIVIAKQMEPWKSWQKIGEDKENECRGCGDGIELQSAYLKSTEIAA